MTGTVHTPALEALVEKYRRLTAHAQLFEPSALPAYEAVAADLQRLLAEAGGARYPYPASPARTSTALHRADYAALLNRVVGGVVRDLLVAVGRAWEQTEAAHPAPDEAVRWSPVVDAARAAAVVLGRSS